MTKVAGQFFPHHIGFGVTVAPFHVRDHAFKGLQFAILAAVIIEIAEFDCFFPGAIQDELLNRFGQRHKGSIHIEVIMFRQ